MATYLDVYNLRYASSIIQSRLTVAIIKASTDILNESALTSNHVNRLIWSKNAIKDVNSKIEQMYWPLVMNSTIQTGGEGSSDSDIQFVVNSFIDSFADGSN